MFINEANIHQNFESSYMAAEKFTFSLYCILRMDFLIQMTLKAKQIFIKKVENYLYILLSKLSRQVDIK